MGHKERERELKQVEKRARETGFQLTAGELMISHPKCSASCVCVRVCVCKESETPYASHLMRQSQYTTGDRTLLHSSSLPTLPLSRPPAVR